MTLTLHYIPSCPFCQRVEILLDLKGRRDAVASGIVDMTKPREPHILALSGGSTALPVLELGGGRSLKESLVVMGYLDDHFSEPAVRRADPYERAIEELMTTMAGAFVSSGYRLVMNQDREARAHLVDAYFEQHAQLDTFLRRHGSSEHPWLFDRFGWAECVFTPFFRRFVLVPFYEGIDLPEGDPRFERVRAWRDACLAHPAAQQVSDEEIIKVYFDYTRNAGNGALLPGRTRSSFAFEPHWRERPMPPRDKYGPAPTDRDLGLA